MWGSATINPGDGFGGRCWGPKFESRFAETETTGSIFEQLESLMPDDGEPRDDAIFSHCRARIIELCGGSEAELLHLGSAWPATSDRQDEIRLAKLICSSKESVLAFISACAAEARAILRRHEHVLKALARELIERRTLNAEQIDLKIWRAVSERQAEAEARRRADWHMREAGAKLFPWLDTSQEP